MSDLPYNSTDDARAPQDFPPVAYTPPSGSGTHQAPPPTRFATPWGAVVALVGFGVMAAGLFALPLSERQGASYRAGFVELRGLAGDFGDRSTGQGGEFFSGLAVFWWRSGAWIFGTALLVALCVVIAAPGARVLGWVIATVAIAGGVLHAFALAQSPDFIAAQRDFHGYEAHSVYNAPGSGIVVSFVGFGVLVVGGVLIGLLRRNPTPIMTTQSPY